MSYGLRTRMYACNQTLIHVVKDYPQLGRVKKKFWTFFAICSARPLKVGGVTLYHKSLSGNCMFGVNMSKFSSTRGLNMLGWKDAWWGQKYL